MDVREGVEVEGGIVRGVQQGAVRRFLLPCLVGVGRLQVACPFEKERGGVAKEGFVFREGELRGGRGGGEDGVRDADYILPSLKTVKRSKVLLKYY